MFADSDSSTKPNMDGSVSGDAKTSDAKARNKACKKKQSKMEKALVSHVVSVSFPF